MSKPIVIAGAGIAGLTAGLAFASRDIEVEIFERSQTLRPAGAGVQLSPNATRILGRLGVLPALETVSVRPPAVVLRDAENLREIARVPLGGQADQRWGAPYLVVHRADLQAVLLAAVEGSGRVRLTYGSEIAGFSANRDKVTALASVSGQPKSIAAPLLVGADGVWSTLRPVAGGRARSLFTGQIAWRRTLPVTQDIVRRLIPDNTVNAFLGAGFHLIAYPVRAGREVNLVAFTRGAALAHDWAQSADASQLTACFAASAEIIRDLTKQATDWRAYPVHTAPTSQRWVFPGLALIGDAAHAMTPYAAQGAATAIEDGYTLAAAVADAAGTENLATGLPAWEAARRRRIGRVRRRGAFNRFAWHAGGPVAMVRDFILTRRPPERLAAEMDWLYGYDPDDELRS